jgi:hypothetical protein
VSNQRNAKQRTNLHAIDDVLARRQYAHQPPRDFVPDEYLSVVASADDVLSPEGRLLRIAKPAGSATVRPTTTSHKADLDIRLNVRVPDVPLHELRALGTAESSINTSLNGSERTSRSRKQDARFLGGRASTVVRLLSGLCWKQL